MTSPNEVLTVMEAAKFLRVGRTTMYRLISEGKVKHIKIGRKTLVPMRYLQLFVEESAEKCYNNSQIDSQPCYEKGDFNDEGNRELTA